MINLSGSILSYANFTNVNFINANLSNAIFTGATLTNAVLTGANLSGVIFSGSQAAQLLDNSANTNITQLQTAVLNLKSAELPNLSSSISIDHIRDLSSNVNVVNPSLVLARLYTCTLTVDSKTPFFINVPALSDIGSTGSVTIQINLQSFGGINLNTNAVTTYAQKTFTLTKNSSDPNDVTITDTSSAPSTVVTNSIVKMGNVLFKLYSFPLS